jgi:hypothetical protein
MLFNFFFAFLLSDQQVYLSFTRATRLVIYSTFWTAWNGVMRLNPLLNRVSSATSRRGLYWDLLMLVSFAILYLW